MAKVFKGRYTADVGQLGDEVVVFLIGMRINKPLKIGLWWPVFTAMGKMLKYLSQRPEKGLLAFRTSLFPEIVLVQYWRSFADLEKFARDQNDPHLEPWRKFNRKIGKSGDVGIWHETYRVRTTDIESIYGNMPMGGLAAASALIPIRRGKDSAAARIGVADDDTPALPTY